MFIQISLYALKSSRGSVNEYVTSPKKTIESFWMVIGILTKRTKRGEKKEYIVDMQNLMNVKVKNATSFGQLIIFWRTYKKIY